MRIRLAFLIAFSLFSNVILSQKVSNLSGMKTGLKLFSFKGIRGNVFDGENGNALSSRIIISNDSGIVSESYYSKLPGFFTEEDGSFEYLLEPGNYSIEVFHGIDYLSQKIPFRISSEKGIDAKIYLNPWFSLKKAGWFNGDGHDHLYTEIKKDTAMLTLVRKICLAQGIDFVCTAQGWAGYNDSNWRSGYSKFSDDRFTIHYGSEMPKYRTGHTWWMGQTSTRNYFWSTMDTTYENQYYQFDYGTTCF